MEGKLFSMYNVVQDNLSATDRKTYVHRIVYFGNYKSVSLLSIPLSTSSSEDPCVAKTKMFFKENIHMVNELCYDEQLTGLLLCYPSYFIHLIEGSETVLLKHLSLILTSEIPAEEIMQQVELSLTENTKNESMHEILQPVFDQLKILTVLHHVNQRLLNNWSTGYSKPPEILGDIDSNITVTEAANYVQKCITKMFQLSEFIQKQDDVIAQNEVLQNLIEHVPNFLPEEGILKILLGSDYLLTVEEFYNVCRNIEKKHLYEDIVWPLPCDFIPYNALEPSIHKTTEQEY